MQDQVNDNHEVVHEDPSTSNRGIKYFTCARYQECREDSVHASDLSQARRRSKTSREKKESRDIREIEFDMSHEVGFHQMVWSSLF